MLALGTTPALLPRRHFGLVGLVLRCRPRLSLRLQTATGRIELVAQGLAAGNLLRQGLGIILASRVCRLRPAQKRRDLAFQLAINAPARSYVTERCLLALALNLEPSTLTRPTRNSFNSLASSRTCKKLSDTAAKFSRRKRAIVSWSG